MVYSLESEATQIRDMMMKGNIFLAGSSAWIIAGTAKYSEKRILIHTLIGVEVVTNGKNTWSLPHTPRHKVSIIIVKTH